MIEIKFDGWDHFWGRWQELLDGFSDEKRKELKRTAMEAASAAVLKFMRKQVKRKGINDAHGRIGRWQGSYTGSRGGYAAVRPQKTELGETAFSGANSPGAITNYLESGHEVRVPSGHAKRYQAALGGKTYVQGFHFYKDSYEAAAEIAFIAAEKQLKRMEDYFK